MSLLAFILSAIATLSSAKCPAFAESTAAVVAGERPLFADDEGREKTAALMVAVAFREGSFLPLAGDVQAGKPTSFCTMQIHLPRGARTAEGWTGLELIADTVKCVTAGLRLLRDSMRRCPAWPIAAYIEGPVGCTSERAQRLSADRTRLAKWVLVRVTKEAE